MDIFKTASRIFLLVLFGSNILSATLPDHLTIESPHLDICRRDASYENCYFGHMGEYLRNRYCLPLHAGSEDPFFIHSSTYAIEVVEMLKGNNPHLDPTFHQFGDVVERFTVRDVPVTVEGSGTSYEFMTRVIESKDERLRFVLFSFYGNKEHLGEELTDWSPKSAYEIGTAPLQVLRAIQQHTPVDSMMCCSLGGICLDVLQYVDEDFLPSTIIWNRALTSTWKVGLSFFPRWFNYPMYLMTSYFGFHADPENCLVDFCRWANQKKVVVIQATEDRYFGGEAALDPTFFEELEKAGTEVYEGSFFVPLVVPIAHHISRLDHIINNENSGTSTKNFLPMKKNMPLSDSLAKHIFMEGDKHTCFVIGGNKDSLDSITYLQVLPLLCSYVKKEFEDTLKAVESD